VMVDRRLANSAPFAAVRGDPYAPRDPGEADMRPAGAVHAGRVQTAMQSSPR
jgi:hypothetical protein